MSQVIRCSLHKCPPSDCFSIHYPWATKKYPKWYIGYALRSLLQGEPSHDPRTGL